MLRDTLYMTALTVVVHAVVLVVAALLLGAISLVVGEMDVFYNANHIALLLTCLAIFTLEYEVGKEIKFHPNDLIVLTVWLLFEFALYFTLALTWAFATGG